MQKLFTTKRKMLNRIFFIGVLVVALSAVEGGSKCPSRIKIQPCRCHEIFQNGPTFTLVTCSKFSGSSDFLNVPRLLDRMMIDRLVLEDYNFTQNQGLTLSNGWFANMRLRELEMYNVKLSQNIGQTMAFSGQEETLVKISLRNSIFDEPSHYSFNLAVLSLTKKLQELDLSWNKITSVTDQLFPSQLVELQIIDFSNNRISSIGQRAFQSVKKLNKINLSHNMITTLPTNMFGSQISMMDFSYNMISTVPVDLFSNTRPQSQVLFAHNNLQSLPMDTWLAAIRVASIVDVSDNFFTCNCSLAWIGSQVQRESQVLGSCSISGEVELQTLRNIKLPQNCTAKL